MVTNNQLILNCRIARKKRYKFLAFSGSPQKKGFCLKINIIKPKKPNSAQRKIAKICLCNDKKIIAYIPGQGHNLQQYSVGLVRGGRVKDLPGVKFKIIRGKYDFKSIETFSRKNSRSKYGIKLLNNED